MYYALCIMRYEMLCVMKKCVRPALLFPSRPPADAQATPSRGRDGESSEDRDRARARARDAPRHPPVKNSAFAIWRVLESGLIGGFAPKA